jgi:hypothetical protein
MMLEFKPRLMNPGDWFEVVTLHDGEPNFHQVTARFADQSKPMKEIGLDYLGPAVSAALTVPPSPDALINRLYQVMSKWITDRRR